jgi:hypothetical protein
VTKIPMPNDFIIEIPIYVRETEEFPMGDVEDLMDTLAGTGRILIDLSRPEFESQVLAAAGRFRSLRRQTRRGGKQVPPVRCGECGEEVKTRELAKHRRERHGTVDS